MSCDKHVPYHGEMDVHFHAWIRTGKMFSMRERQHRTRQAALQTAVKLRADPTDRMIRACTECPRSAPSRRRSKWPAIIATLAQVLKADPAIVRAAVRVARDKGES